MVPVYLLKDKENLVKFNYNNQLSTLLLAAMYFLMAAKEDPLDSFKALTAARTITALGGCSAFFAGFLALATLGAAASTILNRFVKMTCSSDKE